MSFNPSHYKKVILNTDCMRCFTSTIKREILTEENFEICVRDNCGQCPSFPEVEGEGLYCARGPGKRQIERKGCDCPDCPIWVSCGLSRTYYCAQT